MHNWLYHYSNDYVAASWSKTQRAQNVDIIASFLYSKGWTIDAIAAFCGNVEYESYMNPGQWQHSFSVGSANAGYGLVQWTPRTKYSDWAGADWNSDYDLELYRIDYELQADIASPDSLQWIARSPYNLSFYQFTQATAAQYGIAWLSDCFFYSYERGTAGVYDREQNADYWLTYLRTHPPQPWEPVEEKSKFKIMFYLKPWWKR